MSLDSTLEDVHAQSPANSLSGSQPQLYVQTTKVKNSNLNLGQMRGVVQIFKHYFPKGKSLKATEKERRFTAYKKKILSEYGRLVNTKLTSEKALVKRYSEPIPFLKYRLKKTTNMKVSDLSPADQDYYHELGGKDDLSLMIRNIDSVSRMSQTVSRRRPRQPKATSSHPAQKRRRITHDPSMSQSMELESEHNDNRNHNQGAAVNRARDESLPIGQDFNDGSRMPVLTSEELMLIPPKLEQKDSENPKLEALWHLRGQMDVFEREKLAKKKIETQEITKQKMAAVAEAVESQFLQRPHLIGSIPSVENQGEVAFWCWLKHHKEEIMIDPYIANDENLLQTHLVSLKDETAVWTRFLTKWKMWRILKDDQFPLVWRTMKEELKMPTEPVLDEADLNLDEDDDAKLEMEDATVSNSNDKQEK